MTDNENVTPEFKEVSVNPVYMATTEVVKPKGSKGLAIASMILGIISIISCCFYFLAVPCAIAALITGIISLVTKKPGKGMAIAGIVLAIVGILITIILIIAVALGIIAAEANGWSFTDIANRINNY